MTTERAKINLGTTVQHCEICGKPRGLGHPKCSKIRQQRNAGKWASLAEIERSKKARVISEVTE